MSVAYLSQIVYTLSKSDFSVFLDFTDLGSVKHQTKAEVEDAHNICLAAMETYNAMIASVPVDNAAKCVANELCKLLGNSVTTSRDPDHCLDLCSKDLTKTRVVTSVMHEAKEVRDFVKIDRIDSIRLEYNQLVQAIDSIPTAINMCETRMNLCYDYIVASRNQHDFVKLLWGNSAFQEYFKERDNKVQKTTRGILDRCNDNSRWERMDVLTGSLLLPFKRTHKLCSRADIPLSAYVLLVQALRNEINRGLSADNGKFDTVLGAGSRREVASMIRKRFDMDGNNPDGRLGC